MRRFVALFAVLSLLLVAAPATAEVDGSIHFNGKFAAAKGFQFGDAWVGVLAFDNQVDVTQGDPGPAMYEGALLFGDCTEGRGGWFWDWFDGDEVDFHWSMGNAGLTLEGFDFCGRDADMTFSWKGHGKTETFHGAFLEDWEGAHDVFNGQLKWADASATFTHLFTGEEITSEAGWAALAHGVWNAMFDGDGDG